MNPILPWLSSHWHHLVESAGIVASLLFTAVTVRRDLEARRVSEHLTMAGHHRRLWGQLHRREELSRVLESSRDLVHEPVTREEHLFLGLSFVHYHTGWLICREDGSLTPLRVLALDAGNFFRLPAPAAVWAAVSGSYHPEFVAFVNEAVATYRSTQSTPPSSALRS